MLEVELDQVVADLWLRLIPPLSFEEVPDLPVEWFRAVEDVVFQLMLGDVPDKEDVAQDDRLQRPHLPVVEVCAEEEVGGEKVVEEGVAKEFQLLVALSEGTVVEGGVEEGGMSEGLQEEGGLLELVSNHRLKPAQTNPLESII